MNEQNTRKTYEDAKVIVSHLASPRCARFIVGDERRLVTALDAQKMVLLAEFVASLHRQFLTPSRISRIAVSGDPRFDSDMSFAKLLRVNDLIEAEHFMLQYDQFRLMESALA